MKKILIAILVLFSIGAKAQTVIPATTTVDSLVKLQKGTYRFFTIAKKDTVDLAKDTIPKCPVCPVCPKVDSAGIINAYLAAHPCPPPVTCPPIPKQRTAISIVETITATNKTVTINYNDGTSSTL